MSDPICCAEPTCREDITAKAEHTIRRYSVLKKPWRVGVTCSKGHITMFDGGGPDDPDEFVMQLEVGHGDPQDL